MRALSHPRCTHDARRTQHKRAEQRGRTASPRAAKAGALKTRNSSRMSSTLTSVPLPASFTRSCGRARGAPASLEQSETRPCAHAGYKLYRGSSPCRRGGSDKNSPEPQGVVAPTQAVPATINMSSEKRRMTEHEDPATARRRGSRSLARSAMFHGSVAGEGEEAEGEQQMINSLWRSHQAMTGPHCEKYYMCAGAPAQPAQGDELSMATRRRTPPEGLR